MLNLLAVVNCVSCKWLRVFLCFSAVFWHIERTVGNADSDEILAVMEQRFDNI